MYVCANNSIDFILKDKTVVIILKNLPEVLNLNLKTIHCTPH